MSTNFAPNYGPYQAASAGSGGFATGQSSVPQFAPSAQPFGVGAMMVFFGLGGSAIATAVYSSPLAIIGSIASLIAVSAMMVGFARMAGNADLSAHALISSGTANVPAGSYRGSAGLVTGGAVLSVGSLGISTVITLVALSGGGTSSAATAIPLLLLVSLLGVGVLLFGYANMGANIDVVASVASPSVNPGQSATPLRIAAGTFVGGVAVLLLGMLIGLGSGSPSGILATTIMGGSLLLVAVIALAVGQVKLSKNADLGAHASAMANRLVAPGPSATLVISALGIGFFGYVLEYIGQNVMTECNYYYYTSYCYVTEEGAAMSLIGSIVIMAGSIVGLLGLMALAKGIDFVAVNPVLGTGLDPGNLQPFGAADAYVPFGGTGFGSSVSQVASVQDAFNLGLGDWAASSAPATASQQPRTPPPPPPVVPAPPLPPVAPAPPPPAPPQVAPLAPSVQVAAASWPQAPSVQATPQFAAPTLDPSAVAEPAPAAPLPVPPATQQLADPGHTRKRSELVAELQSAQAGATAQGGVLVDAISCPNSHLNPPTAIACRICGTRIETQTPFQASRPQLGVFKLATGEAVPVDRGVIFGRNPQAFGASIQESPYLVKVNDPGLDVSSQHLVVDIVGWTVRVCDLASTNGTTIIPAEYGAPPIALQPNVPLTLELGAKVILGGVFEIVYAAI